MTEPLATCICGEHLHVTADGVLCVRDGAFGPRLTLVYKASGQFTKASYPWLAKVYARVQAGGGAGGGAPGGDEDATSAGAGGGGGAYVEALVDASALANTELVTVGDGGVGSTANGTDGEASAFGSHALALGGQGGLAMGASNDGETLHGEAPSGIGGRPQVGDVKMRGGDGHYGWAVGEIELRKGGRGGNSRFGGGRGGRMSTGVGLPGRANTGEGGGGACVASDSSALEGGAGGSGLVILALYG